MLPPYFSGSPAEAARPTAWPCCHHRAPPVVQAGPLNASRQRVPARSGLGPAHRLSGRCHRAGDFGKPDPRHLPTSLMSAVTRDLHRVLEL